MTSDPSSAGLDLSALRTFMNDSTPTGTQGELRARLISGGKSNLTYEVSDDAHDWILRRPPLGLVLETAHDMSREYRVMKALNGSAVPVPVTVAIAPSAGVLDAPFYVMEKVDGIVYRERKQVAALSDPQQRALGEELVDTLVDLHSIEPAEVGLGDLGRPEGYLERQLRRWRTQFEAAQVRELPAVQRLSDLLSRTLPVTRRSTIVHGDYRIDNVMVDSADPGRITAVLDWEMATLGDPLTDLGILISFWDEVGRAYNPITKGLTAFDGFPTADDVAQRYAQAAGVDVDELSWYVVFGLYKVAIILEQIHARHLQGDTLGDGFDGVASMAPALLDRAQEIAASSTALTRR